MSKSHINLPGDHGLHKDPIEWWYWTAQGETADKQPLALMFALFKGSVFGLKNIYFAHWFITDLKNKTFKPQFEVFWKGFNENGLKQGKLLAGSGSNFLMKTISDTTYRLKTPDFDLKLTSVKPTMLVGGTGLVDLKTSTTHYYSLPRLKTTGMVKLNQRKVKFTGLAWMDHQWSPITLKPEHAWTWFSFQLSDGTDFQCFEYGRSTKTRLATISWPDGKQSVTKKVDFKKINPSWKSKVTGTEYAVRWEIYLPEFDIKLIATPKNEKQEMVHGPFRYWEGPLSAQGLVKGQKVTGNGFLELNGVKSKQNIFKFLLNQLNKHVSSDD